FGNIKLGHGFDAARKFLQENKKVMDEIKKSLKEKMKEETAAAEKA
ncbi:MAG: DNA recombination/repair protein RecA, partial [Candidatus Sungbacteria bacterium]|nr:DNA recombination/repair protein RecA [Candidatus Sungbacteria bacterium]